MKFRVKQHFFDSHLFNNLGDLKSAKLSIVPAAQSLDVAVGRFLRHRGEVAQQDQDQPLIRLVLRFGRLPSRGGCGGGCRCGHGAARSASRKTGWGSKDRARATAHRAGCGAAGRPGSSGKLRSTRRMYQTIDEEVGSSLPGR